MRACRFVAVLGLSCLGLDCQSGSWKKQAAGGVKITQPTLAELNGRYTVSTALGADYAPCNPLATPGGLNCKWFKVEGNNLVGYYNSSGIIYSESCVVDGSMSCWIPAFGWGAFWLTATGVVWKRQITSAFQIIELTWPWAN